MEAVPLVKCVLQLTSADALQLFLSGMQPVSSLDGIYQVNDADVELESLSSRTTYVRSVMISLANYLN